LYVCDDPTSSYVIDFVSGAPGGAELTLFIYVGIAAVALIAVAAFVFMRRRSVSSTVTVK
jgi:LPXTG-motif cell wall-anchored protein